MYSGLAYVKACRTSWTQRIERFLSVLNLRYVNVCVCVRALVCLRDASRLLIPRREQSAVSVSEQSAFLLPEQSAF